MWGCLPCRGKESRGSAKVRGAGELFWGDGELWIHMFFSKDQSVFGYWGGEGTWGKSFCASGDVGWCWRFLHEFLLLEKVCVFHITQ